jgi:CxxC-x17-CxxC domain-containing protein
MVVNHKAKNSNKKGGSMAYEYGSGGYGSGPREMHKATCAECKKECEVPFKPREDRPVYCKDCFSKRKNDSR